MTNCDACVNYEYDEDYECYCCMVNLDEDEMYRFFIRNPAGMSLLPTG